MSLSIGQIAAGLKSAFGFAQGTIPVVSQTTAIPMGVPSNGTMGNNGALSAIAAFQTIYSGGIYLYFPSGVINTSVGQPGYAAGMYFTVMSSTTAGVVYNITYSSGMPVMPTAAQIAAAVFTTTGIGSYTQATIDVPLLNLTLPGGTLGNNGTLMAYPIFTIPNNANVKGCKIWLDGASRYTQGNTTLATEMRPWRFKNAGVQNVNKHSAFLGLNANTGSIIWTAIDTSIDKPLLVTGNLAPAGVTTDYIVLDSFEIQTVFR